MTQRDALIALVGVLVVAALSAVLLTSAVVTQRPPEARPRVVLQRSPVPTARPIQELERRLPPQGRFLAPVVGAQREVSEAARAAQGLLLLLLLTAGTLVFAREQVARTYATSAGGWRTQARVLGVGLAVLVALASVVVLAWSFSVGLIVGGALGPRELFPFGLQLQLAVLSVAFLALAAVSLLGFAAASWRLGTWLLDVPAWRAVGSKVPAPLAALLGATLLYGATRLPLVGLPIGVAILAYALGAFVVTRIRP